MSFDCVIEAIKTVEGALRTQSALGERNTVSKELCCSKCKASMWKKKIQIHPDTAKFLCSRCHCDLKRLRSGRLFTCGICKQTIKGQMQKIPGTKTVACQACVVYYRRTGKVREVRRRWKQARPKQKGKEAEQSSSESPEFTIGPELKKPLKSFRIDDILGLSSSSSCPTPVWTQVDEDIQLLENPKNSFQGLLEPMDIPYGIGYAKIQKHIDQQELGASGFDDVCCNPLCKIGITGRRGKHPETLESLCIPCSDYLRENNRWRQPEKVNDNTSPRIPLACYKLRCVKPLSQRNYVNLTLGKYVCWECHKRWH